MVKKDSNWLDNRWVEGCTPPSLDESKLLRYFSYSRYCNIFYLLQKKGYTYRKELDGLVATDSRYCINALLADGIIEEFSLSDRLIYILKITKGLNEQNIFTLKTYRLTELAKQTLDNPFFDKLIKKNLSLNINKYIDYLSEIYFGKTEQLEKSKNDERVAGILRTKAIGAEVPIEDKIWYENYTGRKYK